MGLDMYVRARTLEPEPTEYGDTWREWNKRRELAYWRKHPNLHGFIVREFGGGVDECQEIPLTRKDVQAILDASEADRLPHTSGFFFGTTQPEDKRDTRTQLCAVLAWMLANPGGEIFYQASW